MDDFLNKNSTWNGVGNTLSLTQQPVFLYDSSTRNFVASLSTEILAGVVPMHPVDNCNIGVAPTSGVGFTSAVVAAESTNQAMLTGQFAVVPKLYSVAAATWLEPITVSIVEAGTNATVSTFDVSLRQNMNTQSHRSYFFSTTSGGVTTIMPCTPGSLKPNSTGEFGDLNLLAPIFILIVAGVPVIAGPGEDKDITESMKKIFSIPNPDGLDVQELINVSNDRRIDFLKERQNLYWK